MQFSKCLCECSLAFVNWCSSRLTHMRVYCRKRSSQKHWLGAGQHCCQGHSLVLPSGDLFSLELCFKLSMKAEQQRQFKVGQEFSSLEIIKRLVSSLRDEQFFIVSDNRKFHAANVQYTVISVHWLIFVCAFKGLGQIQADCSKSYVDSRGRANNPTSIKNHKYRNPRQIVRSKLLDCVVQPLLGNPGAMETMWGVV